MIRQSILKISIFVMALMAFVAVVPAKANGKIFVSVSPSSGAVERVDATKPVTETISHALIFRDINDYPASSAAVTNPHSPQSPFNNQSFVKRMLSGAMPKVEKVTVRFKREKGKYRIQLIYRHGKYQKVRVRIN